MYCGCLRLCQSVDEGTGSINDESWAIHFDVKPQLSDDIRKCRSDLFVSRMKMKVEVSIERRGSNYNELEHNARDTSLI